MLTSWLFLDSTERYSPSHTTTRCSSSTELRDGSWTMSKQCTTVIYLCSIRHCRWLTCNIIGEVCHCVQMNWPWFEDRQTRQASWRGDVRNRNESYGDIQHWNGSGRCEWSERGDYQDSVRQKRKQLLTDAINRLTGVPTCVRAYQYEVIKSFRSRRVGAKHYTMMPMEHTFLITQGSQSRTVVHKQLPFTAAYAFTDGT